MAATGRVASGDLVQVLKVISDNADTGIANIERQRVHGLMQAVGDILPGAWKAALKEVRVGLRPAPDGQVPFIGRSANSPRVILATGHFRNGVMLAPLTAARVAAAVTQNL